MGKAVRLTSRAVGSVSGLAEDTSDAEVPACVDGGREEGGFAFHLPVEAGEVGLVEDFLHFFGVGVGVENGFGG